MSNLSIRLPNDLEDQLDQEAKLLHKRRSDVVREAIGEYLSRRERERLMAQMAQETQRLAARDESQSVEDDFAQADSEILEDEPIGQGSWWK